MINSHGVVSILPGSEHAVSPALSAPAGSAPFPDPEDEAGRLRIWDLIDGDLVERDLGGPEALLCDALGLYWCVRTHPELGPILRLSRDSEGSDLIPTQEERLAELEAERAKRC